MKTITPRLYRIYRQSYVDPCGASFLREKSQYVFRFLVFCEGEATAHLGERRLACRVGDVLYLPPGECYRLEPHTPFTVYQVAFSLHGGEEEARPLFCVFTPELRRELCLPLPEGEEYAPLAASDVFSHTSAVRVFTELMSVDPRGALFPFLSTSALSTVLAELLRPTAPRLSPEAEIVAYINAHPEEPLTAGSLSERFSYHPNYLNALIKQETGFTLTRYVRRVRIAHACDLMACGALSPAEAASALGYYDYSHFYKAFRAEVGVSPKEYLAHTAAAFG